MYYTLFKLRYVHSLEPALTAQFTKCNVMKCRIKLANTNSANALCLEIPAKGVTNCSLNDTNNTNCPTHTTNPAKKALNGKLSLISLSLIHI